MISVIVLTYNNLELNKKCIDSLLKYCDSSTEIIIIDNNSTDGTPKYLNTLSRKRIKVVLNKKNANFAGGCNQGAKIASGDTLIFLNNDTAVKKNWAQSLEKSLNEDNVGAVGSKLLYPNGKIQHAGIVISNDRIPRHIYRLRPSNWPKANIKRKYRAVTAASLAITKKLFNKLGGFDEGFINGLEDIDLCLRVGEEGKKIVYCPDSVAVHYESVNKNRFDHYFKNRERFFKKWPNLVPDEDDYYKKDGFGALFIFREHINNRYLTGSYKEKITVVLKKIFNKNG